MKTIHALLPIVVVWGLLHSGPAEALQPERLADSLERAGDLSPLFEALDVSALASDAGQDNDVKASLDALRDNLVAGALSEAALAENAAEPTLRLTFADGGLNYLSLQVSTQGRLQGWYDYALGVHLRELVAALAGLEQNRARRLLEAMENTPLRALDSLPPGHPGRVLSRLVLAACASQPCYAGALAEMQPLEPQRASLWRYERTILDQQSTDEAMAALRDDLGAEPGLLWLEVAQAVREGQCAKALTLASQGIDRWPGYRPLYAPAAQCAVMLRQYARATGFFRELQDRFGIRVDWEVLGQKPDFRPYLESESFREWQGKAR